MKMAAIYASFRSNGTCFFYQTRRDGGRFLSWEVIHNFWSVPAGAIKPRGSKWSDRLARSFEIIRRVIRYPPGVVGYVWGSLSRLTKVKMCSCHLALISWFSGIMVILTASFKVDVYLLMGPKILISEKNCLLFRCRRVAVVFPSCFSTSSFGWCRAPIGRELWEGGIWLSVLEMMSGFLFCFNLPGDLRNVLVEPVLVVTFRVSDGFYYKNYIKDYRVSHGLPKGCPIFCDLLSFVGIARHSTPVVYSMVTFESVPFLRVAGCLTRWHLCVWILSLGRSSRWSPQ